MRGPEPGERTHDHTFAQQRLEPGLRVLAQVDEHEVSDGRAGHLVTRFHEDLLELPTAFGIGLLPALELAGRIQAGERSFLRRSRQVERSPRLAERSDELGRACAVADPGSGQAVDLRERSQHDHLPASSEVLLDAVRIVGIVDVLEVRLIEHGQHVLRNSLEVCVELAARVHRSRRVVGMADVHELGPLRDRLQQGLQVVAVIAERHRDGLRAQLARVDRIARERRPAEHDLVARFQDGLRDTVDQTVGPRAHRDLLEANAVAFGERCPQTVRAPVRVAVQVTGGALQCLERLRERPERSFVRGEFDHALEPELALNLFDRLARLVGDDPCELGPQEADGYVPHYELGVVWSDFLRQNQSTPPAAANIEAIAPLFNPACSPVPGTAARALRFPNFFATFQTPQPNTAFRRLMIPIGSPFTSEPTKHLPNRDRAHAREKDGLFVLAPAAPGMLHDRARQLETSRLGLLRFLVRRGATGGVDS